MSKRTVMKALLATTVNLVDGSILVLDPKHTTDNRARYPTLKDERDVERLEREKIAEVHEGPIPALDEERAEEEEHERTIRARERGVAGDEGRDAKPKPEPKPKAEPKPAGGKAAKAPAGKAKAGDDKPKGGDPIPETRGSTKGGPGVETEDEAAAAADILDGADPTEAPAGGAAAKSD